MKAFVNKLLRLALNRADSEPEYELDRAHRALRLKPLRDQPPGPFIVKFFQSEDKYTVVRKLRTAGQILIGAHQYFIHENGSRETTMLRQQLLASGKGSRNWISHAVCVLQRS